MKSSRGTDRRRGPQSVCIAAGVIAMAAVLFAAQASRAASFAEVIDSVQPKIVKIYGAGGLRNLEAYQSGFLISADGYVLTVWSYVLDTEFVAVVLNDGRRFEAELKGHDPVLEIALLKIDARDLPYFNLDTAVDIEPGDKVLAFSNLYAIAAGNEPASVLHGRVSVKSDLAARRGAFESLYQGPVYVLDAMTNNPGAFGGALTDRRGRLAGILGKELRNSMNNTWLNYAIPISALVSSVYDLQAGKFIRPPNPDARRALDPVTLAALGIVLVPDVLDKTPPFVDKIVPDSPADRAGLKPDDLLLYVNSRLASSCKTVVDELTFIERHQKVQITAERADMLIEVVLSLED